MQTGSNGLQHICVTTSCAQRSASHTVNKLIHTSQSVTQYSWRNTINNSRNDRSINLFESNYYYCACIFITTSFRIIFKFFLKKSLSSIFPFETILEIRLHHRRQLISIYRENSRFSWKRVSSSLSRAFPCAAFDFRVARASNVDRYRGS